MKTLKFLLVIALFSGFAFSQTAQAQTQKVQTKTESFKVWGNCDMCKTRIENAVKSAGATAASWDKKTKMLTVTYDPSKYSIDTFSKKLAEVGHDTEKYKADDKVYNSLPGCCRYDRN
jgi:periplasmic mercuric ion binding protein